MIKNTYKFGILAEKIAILMLILKGYRILESRFKTPFGEIDIIAKKSNEIIAIEVKARKSEILIEEILHLKQIERIKRSFEFFLANNKEFCKHNLRCDFIEVDRFLFCKHHKNFF